MDNGMGYFKKRLGEIDKEIIEELNHMKRHKLKVSERFERLKHERVSLYIEFLASHKESNGVIDTFMRFEQDGFK